MNGHVSMARHGANHKSLAFTLDAAQLFDTAQVGQRVGA